jgi:DNA-binding transcriptional ArsR family regulator
MDPDVDGTSEVSYHLGKLAGFGYVEEAGRQKGKRSAYLCFYRLKPEYEDIVSTLAQRGDAVTVTAVSNLERPASSNVLETIARCLGADGSPYDSLTAIADIIRGEGVSVTLPGEEPAEDAALTPEKLGQMKRLNLRRGECGCPTPIADGDGHCVNCTKPITRVAA